MCGLPQQSILGLIPFYLLPSGEVIRRQVVDFQSYADDTQLYIGVTSADLEPINVLLNYILYMKS